MEPVDSGLTYEGKQSTENVLMRSFSVLSLCLCLSFRSLLSPHQTLQYVPNRMGPLICASFLLHLYIWHLLISMKPKCFSGWLPTDALSCFLGMSIFSFLISLVLFIVVFYFLGSCFLLLFESKDKYKWMFFYC